MLSEHHWITLEGHCGSQARSFKVLWDKLGKKYFGVPMLGHSKHRWTALDKAYRGSHARSFKTLLNSLRQSILRFPCEVTQNTLEQPLKKYIGVPMQGHSDHCWTALETAYWGSQARSFKTLLKSFKGLLNNLINYFWGSHVRPLKTLLNSLRQHFWVPINYSKLLNSFLQ